MAKFYLYQETGYTIEADDADEVYDIFMEMNEEERNACMNDSNHIEVVEAE